MSLPRRAVVFLLVTWTLVVLYPDPSVLVTSVRNLLRPEADAAAAAALAEQLPDDPRLIEAQVLERVPYATDWATQGVPWRFPSAAEAVREGRGDCESRALVLASVLAAKGIPHELRLSIDHIWVDYPGKEASANENDALVLAERDERGLHLRLPADFSLRRELRSQVRMYWDPMPWMRRILLTLGLLLIPVGARMAAGGGLGGRRPLAAGPAAGSSSARSSSRRSVRRRGSCGQVAAGRPER
jgi:hypothetical protein